ncbi:heparinase II/III family protein [Pseudooceanicola nanhaiensis]|uniref:heparinase II/III family protein n=1 Tax=Pseudooceanicola nanhaiensis TaxID=375761 RepID=UPI001CD323D2|nr:heparinase II/III family protein [Pseudooceanicola nanhaiensis]MCA0918875.1 heparinase II/III family protein [Pseudooceanicola nanhaiensis]
MTASETREARGTRLLNRFHARLSGLARPATAFTSQPEPRTIGSFARGRQLVAGNYLFAGHLVEQSTAPLWDLPMPDRAFLNEIHGFSWLDDLAAVGDQSTRAKAQEWLWLWIERYGRGGGPGWTPDLAGRRLIRWINHALFLLRGQDKAAADAFFRSLARQTIFLSHRWKGAAPGLPRFEALTGMIYAGLALQGMEKHVAPAARALARECASQIDAQGGLPTRNPEELLEVFTLLSWAAAVLTESNQVPRQEHLVAIERMSPTLRTLRHADGSLARFHGGGKGAEGRLDHALAASGVKTRHPDGLSMGYARLSAGRTSVIVDAAAPPEGKASMNAHASTLAFELTSGRRPVVVNCGSGISFGLEWRRAGRATPSHSTLALEGLSSARLGPATAQGEPLIDGPKKVPIRMSQAPDGLRFQGGHDGYLRSHGLTHARTLELTFDGRGMAGEDLMLAIEDREKKRFDKAMDSASLGGIPYQIRFHLHPDVEAQIDMGGTAVSLALKSGELWVFRHDGKAELRLDPSVYLEKNRLKPRATKQIVLSSRAMLYATRIRWSLAKAQDTPISIRDLHRDDGDAGS